MKAQFTSDIPGAGPGGAATGGAATGGAATGGAATGGTGAEYVPGPGRGNTSGYPHYDYVGARNPGAGAHNLDNTVTSGFVGTGGGGGRSLY